MRNGGIQSPITYSAEAEITPLIYCVDGWLTKTRWNVRLIEPRESITKLTELLHFPLVKNTLVSHDVCTWLGSPYGAEAPVDYDNGT
jgi:hypothetical protein